MSYIHISYSVSLYDINVYNIYRIHSVMLGTEGKAQPQEGAWDKHKYEWGI